MNRPTNIWMITTEEEFSQFVISSNGWVVLLTENPIPFLKNHPNSLGASILLPPYESIAAEIDGNSQVSDEIYIRHLNSSVCSQYINAILVATIARTPIAIYIGKEELGMRFVQIFLNYLFNVYGITVGSNSMGIIPSIDEKFLPIILNQLYLVNAIDYNVFMINYPVGYSLDMSVIPKMVAEVNPLIKGNDIASYYQYFSERLVETKNNNNIILEDPFIKGDDNG